MITVSIFLIRRKPVKSEYSQQVDEEDDVQENLIDRENKNEVTQSMTSDRPPPEVVDDFEYPGFKAAAFHPRTWHLWILVVFSSCFGFFIAANFKAYGSNVDDFDDSYLTTVGAIGAVLNGFSRAFWATL